MGHNVAGWSANLPLPGYATLARRPGKVFDTRHANVDLVCCGGRQPVCSRLQRHKFQLVSGGHEAKGWTGIAAGGLTKEVAFETVEAQLMTASMMPIERNISRARI
jgi:hypothetical protein